MHSGFAQGCSLTKRSGECIHGLHACTWGRWQQRSVHRKGLSSVLGMERQSKSFQCQARKHFVVELQHVLPDCLCLVQPCSKLKAMEVPPNCKASRSFAGHFLGSFSLFLLVGWKGRKFGFCAAGKFYTGKSEAGEKRQVSGLVER